MNRLFLPVSTEATSLFEVANEVENAFDRVLSSRRDSRGYARNIRHKLASLKIPKPAPEVIQLRTASTANLPKSKTS